MITRFRFWQWRLLGGFSVLAELDYLGIAFVSFREQLDTVGPLGRAVMIIVSAIAELERSLIVERVQGSVVPGSKAVTSAVVCWTSTGTLFSGIAIADSA